ncbi:MAG: hypothetical protein IT246_07995 [Bacteroidia bacterium]|nr:hypothetical protein [Bacteroidia bacterium]
MKKVLFVCFVGLISACSLAKFTIYPGQAVHEFPQKMQGTYFYILNVSLLGNHKSGDTLFYQITPNSVIMIDSMKHTEKKLDSSFVLSLVKQKYWILSYKDSEMPDYWNCMMYSANKKGLQIFPIIEEKQNTKLQKYFGYKPILDANKDTLMIYSASDEQMAKYLKKEVKETIKLKRLQINTAK